MIYEAFVFLANRSETKQILGLKSTTRVSIMFVTASTRCSVSCVTSGNAELQFPERVKFLFG